jgi:hypothetical protein
VDEVWAFLSDFTTTEGWDPPTVSTVRATGDGGVGTEYANTSRVLVAPRLASASRRSVTTRLGRWPSASTA